ncbi:hypothetical protein T492DRAFT_834713 [Pavlovales sp. CCMP2436]|nr:hypothetical protein T492DRAFT_834713 [Pavlovales sp. CCMP2436]
MHIYTTKIAVTDKDTINFFTGNILPQSYPSAPNVITLIEARFWVMCGVKLNGIAAMITGSINEAYVFAELAATDPDLNESRVKIRIVGNGCIEIEYPPLWIKSQSRCAITDKQTLDFENIDELKTMFKVRNYDLLGPLEASSGKLTIMTGAAGSGKTQQKKDLLKRCATPDC